MSQSDIAGLIMLYLMFGAFFGFVAAIETDSLAKGLAVTIFWPILIIFLAIKGLIEILREGL